MTRCGVTLYVLLIPTLCGSGAFSAIAQKLDWQRTQRMTLERQFAGPLTDTLIQRLRDPVDGSVCYVYLPISAAHTEKTDAGYVQYGPNTIGTISCTVGSVANSITGSAPRRPQ